MEQVERYREDGESRSAAVRRLLRAGLEHPPWWVTSISQIGNVLSGAMVLVALVWFFTSWVPVSLLGGVVLATTVVNYAAYGLITDDWILRSAWGRSA